MKRGRFQRYDWVDAVTERVTAFRFVALEKHGVQVFVCVPRRANRDGERAKDFAQLLKQVKVIDALLALFLGATREVTDRVVKEQDFRAASSDYGFHRGCFR